MNKDIGSISEFEQRLILEEFNDTLVEYPREKTVVQLFEEQVEKTPENIALVFEGEQLTYRELNKRANALAHELRELGIGPDDYVAIMAVRSIEMIVGIYGIIKAGGAYVPIDPTYPKDRIHYILEDCQPKVLLTNQEKIEVKVNIPMIDLKDAHLFSKKVENLTIVNKATDLIYLIYTSGTTGKPKGVMIEHRNVLNLMNWQKVNGNYTTTTAVLQNFNYIFDGSVWEIFPALLSGCTLEIISVEGRYDLKIVLDLLPRKHVMMTPSMFKLLIDYAEEYQLLDQLNSFERLYMGGESLPYDLTERYRKIIGNNIEHVFNVYGPTEATVCATAYRFNQTDDKICIGKPISNTQVYILAGNKFCGIGIIGELCIAGAGLARGYLNQPELTAEKFVDNPFGKGKLYRTGDLAKWLPDGNIEHLGRIDEQVKIRGFRIELGEIESAIRAIREVKDCVVIAREDAGREKVINAYVVSDIELSLSLIRESLAKSLPDYMIPSYMKQIECIPLTRNGKLDKEALPEIEAKIEKEYVAPRNEKEEIVSHVFKEILGFSEISALANFYELGGDSIKAMRMISKLRNQGYQVSIEAIMMDKTVAGIAKSLKTLKKEDKLDQSEVTGEVALTPIQKQFFACRLAKPHHFNQSALFESQMKLDLVALKRALGKITEHHDMLRATYQNGIQIIEPVHEENFVLVHYENVDQAFMRQKGDALQGTLDIEKGPLVKAIVFETLNANYLLLCIHHLVVDGISWRILSEDLNTSYEAAKEKQEMSLPLKTLSFQKWSLALKNYRTSYHLKKEIPFWKQTEAIIKESRLPSSPAEMPSGMQTQSFSLSKELTEQLLYHAPRPYHLEINDLLLAALFGAMHQVTGLTSLATFMEGHGREKVDGAWLPIDRTVGWFTTIYPLAVSEIGSDIEKNLCLVKEAFRKIPNHGLGYTVLKSDGEAVLTNEEPSMTFNYLGNFTHEVNHQALKMLDIDHGYQVSKKNRFGTPIVVDGAILDDQLRMLIEFDTEKFSDTLISNLKEAYHEQLRKTIQHCISQKEVVLTPSDLNEREWHLEEFIKVKTDYEQKGWLIEQILPLTALQEGMLYHKLTDAEDSQYVVQQRFKVKGDLDIALLKKSFELLSKKHQMLRMNIVYQNVSIPRQVIMQEKEVEFNYEDLSNKNDAQNQLEKLEYEDRALGFDLENDALIRMTVTTLPNEDTRLRLTFHHIMMDAWCLSQLEHDLLTFYDQLASNAKISERVADHQYEDFIQLIQAKNHEEGLAYWQELLLDYEEAAATIPSLEINDDHKAEGVQVLRTSLTEVDTKRLEKISGNYGITLNTIIEAAWAIILQRYNNGQDVVFGKVVSGRGFDLKGIENMIGLFINTIPVRVTTTPELTFLQLIKTLQEQALKSSHYDYCSLAEIGSHIQRPNLITSLLNFENYYQQDEKVSHHLHLESLGIKEATNYGINLSIKKSEILEFEMMYEVRKYGQAHIQRVLDQLRHLLKQVIKNVDMPIVNFELLDEKQRDLMLSDFNDTFTEYPREKTVVQLFEEQVAKTPENVAVVYEDRSLTYEELNARANTLAHQLRELGVKPDDYVAIIAERSLEMIIGIYGIIKSGGAYVPIDPTHPVQRINYILGDCQPKALLMGGEKMEMEVDMQVVDLRALDHPIREIGNLERINKPNDLAYLIYTSGTTGKPKGVMVEHRNVLNLVNWQKANGNYQDTTTILQNFNYIFDGSVWEIFPALSSGCTLEIISVEGRYDLKIVLELLPRKHMMMTPSMFKMLIDYAEEYQLLDKLNSFEKLYMGGESLSADLIKRYGKIIGNNIEHVFNVYGPTEATVCATAYRFSQTDDKIFIGKPISNTQVYIFAGNKLCDVGMIGELCIGGDGITRGYLNRPDLTKEKFIQNPYGEGKLYRTGDLARWLSDGNIEYLGRMDDQVKIRGFRIELGEIESALRKIQDVADAVVVIKEDKHQEQVIHAYLVSNKKLVIDQVQEELSSVLPLYMIPPYMKQISEIPLTTIGKINKKALPVIELENEKQYVAPQDEKEKIIMQIFSDVLAVEKVSRNHSFFELGGDSIKAMRVVSKMREAGYGISVKEIMDKYIIKAIARSAVKEIETGYEQGEITGSVMPTPIIKSFTSWNLEKPHHYNQSVMIKTDQFEPELKQILTALVIHHDMLRAVYQNHTLDILNSQDRKLYDFHTFDLRYEERVTDKIEGECQHLQEAIDLKQGPLMKVALFKTSNDNYLFICIHHLVIDYVSWRILLDDFHTLKRQLTAKRRFLLPAKTASFQAWSQLLSEYKNSPQLAKEKGYWVSVNEDLALGMIQGDAEGEQVGRSYVDVYFGKAETKKLLYQAGKAFQTEINDLLLSAMGIAVQKLTGQVKVSIGLEGHGREELHTKIEIDRTVGWFTSIYPVIVAYEEDIDQCIIKTKEMLRKIPNNGLGYGLLMENDQENPDFYFNYLGEFNEDTHDFSKGLDISADNKMLGSINFNGLVAKGELSFRVTYDLSKHSEMKMKRFGQLYQESLIQVIDCCLKQETSIKTLSDYGVAELMESEFSEIMDIFD